MHTELSLGIGPIQVVAIFFHVGVLVIVQQLLDRLAKVLRVDRLSLINDTSTRTVVVRALLTRFDLWIWASGVYTLAAWHLSPLLDPLLGAGWATPQPLRTLNSVDDRSAAQKTLTSSSVVDPEFGR
jgi:hypothetical protein